MKPGPPSGTVTFLFTDIEGSTKLSQAYTNDLPVLLARHKEILQQAIKAYDGFIFQVVGDSFAAAFGTAVDALRAATEAQRFLHREDWFPMPIKVRMGIHTGAAQLVDDASVHGPYAGYTTLAATQRIMSAAHGGQLLVSQVTRDLVLDQLPPEISLVDMGEHYLKDLRHPVHLYQVAGVDLPVHFPPIRSLSELPNNLPIQLTGFIGREREMEEVKQLLSRTRLLTLIGPGGTGKTRLALQTAQTLLSSFRDGIWFLELSPITDRALIPKALAEVFGLRELPNLPVLQIVKDYLRAKTLLLILDNCEHLVDACAELSDRLLQASPSLKILASSREALGIRGEAIYLVPSLSLPDLVGPTLDTLSSSEAVTLFVERAKAANSRFRLVEQNAHAVAQICHRLDGIPLALELAAARVTVFSPGQILSRLDDQFRLLTGGSRTALERHQTLRALIDWSYDLLTPEEQKLFRQLSVFAGGWTFEAAEAVCPGLDLLSLLPQLINKSLVMVDEQPAGTRYHLLETIRQYARDKLVGAGEGEQARNLHLHFFRRLADDAGQHFNRFDEMKWQSGIEADIDNLRIALEWALEKDVLIALRMGTAMAPYWSRHGYEIEGCHLIQDALARFQELLSGMGQTDPQSMSVYVRALGALEVLSFAGGDFTTSLQAAEKAVTLARQIGEKRTLAESLSYMGVVKAFLGDAEISVAMAEEALMLAREIGDKALLGLALTNMAGVTAMTRGDPSKMQSYSDEGIQLLKDAGAQWGLAMASFGNGLFAVRQGNYMEARVRFEASIPVFTMLNDKHRVNMAYSEIAHVERRLGHFKDAKAHYRRTLLEWQRIGHRAAVAHELECFAFIARAEEQEVRAATLLGAAQILRETINLPMTPFEEDEYESEVTNLQAGMENAAFARAWAEGRTLTMEHAIALAIEENSP